MFYANYLSNIGVGPHGAALALAKHAASKGWSMSTFEYELYQQKFFRHDFPGLVNKNGSLNMSVGEYISRFNSAKGMAQQYGLSLDRAQFATFVNKKMSGQEMASRFEAISTVKQNANDLAAFNGYLKDTGVIKKNLTETQLFHFVMGKGDPAWYNAWRGAEQAVGAAQAGFQLGTDITSAQLKAIAAMDPEKANTPGAITADIGKWQAAAKDWQSTEPGRGLGVNLGVKDVAELEFGGPNAAKIAAQIDVAKQTAANAARSAESTAVTIPGTQQASISPQTKGQEQGPRTGFGTP